MPGPRRENEGRSEGFYPGLPPGEKPQTHNTVKIDPEVFDLKVLVLHAARIIAKDYPGDYNKAEATARKIINDLSPKGSTHPSVNQTPTAPEEIQPRLF